MVASPCSTAALAAACSLLLTCGGQPALAPPSAAALLAQRPYTIVGGSGATPAPLVVALHGLGGTGQEIGDDLQLTALSQERGFWLALPDGTANGNREQFWNPQDGRPPWDVAYLAAVIDDARARHAVDPKRVFVVGFSLGAFLAHRLACDLAPRIAAIASIAGEVPSDPAQCAPAAPVSVVEIHGDRDKVIPYQPGTFGGGARETAGTWARNDRCSGALQPTGQRLDLVTDVPGDETLVEAVSGCPAGVSVELWTMEGAGHSPTAQAGFGANVYRFLTAHPKP